MERDKRKLKEFKRFLVKNNCRELYLSNCRKYRSFGKFGSIVYLRIMRAFFNDRAPREYLIGAFTFANTNEGQKFWFNLHLKWYKEVNKLRMIDRQKYLKSMQK